jgi:hypothetical protein
MKTFTSTYSKRLDVNMPKDCSPDDLAIAFIARARMNGGRMGVTPESVTTGIGFSRPDKTVFNASELAKYEQRMAKEEARNFKANLQAEASNINEKQETYKGLKENARKTQEAMGVLNTTKGIAQALLPPSMVVPSRIYTPTSQSLQKFQEKYATATKEEAKAAYMKEVAPQFKAWQDNLTKLAQTHRTAEEFSRVSKNLYGISSGNLYHVMDYLDHWAEGGNWFKSAPPNSFAMGFFGKGLEAFSKNVQRWNLKWTLSNIAETHRLFVHYRPDQVLTGLVNALRATKGSLMSELPELKQSGAYGMSWERDAKTNWIDKVNPFALSINVQKNLAWFTDKASGGNGHNGIKKVVLERPSWDMPMIYNESGMRHTLSMTRYMYAETMQNVELYKEARKSPMGALKLVNSLVIRSAFFGVPAVIPSLLWKALPNEEKEKIEELNRLLPTAPPFGYMAEYVQPFNELFLAGTLQNLVSTANKAGSHGFKGGVALLEGDSKMALSYLVNSAMHAGVFVTIPQSVAKLSDALVKILEDELEGDEAWEAVFKKELGTEMGKGIGEQLASL